MNKTQNMCRMPQTHILYTHLLGLSLALLSSLILTLSSFSSGNWITHLSYLIIFILLTYYLGGLLVLFSALVFFLPFLFNWLGSELLEMLKWYFLLYAAGIVFAQSYNFLLFYYIKKFNKRILSISFAYRPDKKFNIVKSPISGEEVPKINTDGIKPTYDYTVENIPDHPYTILFVANPKLCSRFQLNAAYPNRDDFDNDLDAYRKNSANYVEDPIINDEKLFYRMVDRALNSFENDEVLGQPEIWSCVCVITIFDPQIANIGRLNSRGDWTGNYFGFAEAYQVNRPEADITFENILAPLDHTCLFLKDKWNQYQANNKNPIPFKEVDVIYVLSANETYDRSCAMYSDKPNGQIYKGDPPQLSVMHDEYTDAPGIVALNVLTAWQKTYIHEFGHAMSALQNGAIIDEYMDYNEVSFGPVPELQALNRLERTVSKDPIPAKFASYNKVDYHSDRDHPSERANWKGYFPQRWAKHIGCTMDATIGDYRFDPLISDFMYDRLMAKRIR